MHLVLMRPCLVPRRAFLRVFHTCMIKEKGWVEARHNKGVYLTLCLRRNESRKFKVIIVLNLATVDAPGVIFFIPVWLYVSHHCILTDAVYFGIHIPHG